MVCAYRARASRWAKPLFVDPWAEALAGEEGEAIARRLDERFPPMETWLALRVAYLDRLVGLAVDRLSIRQFPELAMLDPTVLLDIRIVPYAPEYRDAFRDLNLEWIATYFEVDQPATQASKRERLASVDGYPFDAARFVACNFEREDPIERLVASGFDAREPALVLWEGVVPYLTEPAVRATASRLAGGLDARALVAFDFVGKRFAAGEKLTDKDLETRAYVGELGEPIRFGSDHILPLLVECGFRWVRSLDFDELALELLGDYRRDRMFRFQHLALAAPRAPVAEWP